jgi:nucleotide-binding universal stress UspA family protein
VKMILVALDGSAESENSVPYAERLARSSGATLVLMRGILTVPGGLRGARSFNESLRAEAHAYLQGHCERLQATGLDCQSVIVDDEAGHAILKAAYDRNVDLIVMSTHGRGGLARALWGSVADRVMRSAPSPVLLVPHGLAGSWELGETPSLVVPLDGSAVSEASLGPAADLAADLKARLILVQSVALMPMVIGAGGWSIHKLDASRMEVEKAAALTYLDGIAACLKDRGVDTQVVAAEGPAASVIQNVVSANHAHAVVMATHGRGGAFRVLMGSTAEALVRSAVAPILLVRPRAANETPLEARRQPMRSFITSR